MANDDLKFFTNEAGDTTLYDRFKRALSHTRYFDILVGYFRSSGFFRLYKEFESIEKVRILFGLNIDNTTFKVIENNKSQQILDFESSDKIKEDFPNLLLKEIEVAEDEKDVEEVVEKLPIPEISKEQQQPIIDLVDKILNAKQNDPTTDTFLLESEIDKIVYQLYNLTDAEIRIIEGK